MPKGLKRVTEAWWPDIEAHVQDVLDRIDEPNPLGLLPLEFVDPAKGMFGCGIWGCVYPFSSTERLVLKVSLDPSEGAIFDAIRAVPSLRNHPGVAWLADIGRLPEKHTWRGKTYDVWVIVRENVSPYDYQAGIVQWPGFNTALLEARKWGHHFGLRRARVEQHGDVYGRQRRMDEAASEWEDAVYELEATPPGEALGEFIQLFYQRYSGILSDAHLANIGWPVHDLRDIAPETSKPTKMVKVFDPGHSWLPSDFDERLLRAVLGHIEPNPNVPVIGG